MKAQIGPENLLIYSENLYENSPELDSLRSLGQFEKSILFLVNENDFNGDNEALFIKICEAVALKDSDYKLVVLSESTNPLSIINELKPTKTISFNINTTGLSKILNNVVLINDIQLLNTTSITQISTDQEAKKNFWNALKKLIAA